MNKSINLRMESHSTHAKKLRIVRASPIPVPILIFNHMDPENLLAIFRVKRKESFTPKLPPCFVSFILIPVWNNYG